MIDLSNDTLSSEKCQVDISREELINKMKDEGFRLTRSTLNVWEKKILIPRARVVSGGRGIAPKAMYEPWMVERIRTVLEMRREGSGLEDISKYLARTHIAKVLRLLKKYGHQDTDIYKTLEGWRELSWEEIIGFRGAHVGGKSFFSSYNDIVRELLATFICSPKKLGQFVAVLEFLALREKMAKVTLRKELLEELIMIMVEKKDEWVLTRDDLAKIHKQHVQRSRRLSEPLKKAIKRLHGGKIPDDIKKTHF